MVLDTSALLAILLAEPEIEAFSGAIEADPIRWLSAASWVEASVVMEARFGAAGLGELDSLIREAEIELIPFDSRQAALAREAYSLYGKGRHPAGLNLGDCFSYALAKAMGQSLLFKGKDFPQTDMVPALPKQA
jgi:ribonuclease VapC